MYFKDFKEIDFNISQIKLLLDEIPRDLKSKTFFQPNRSLHELLSHFLKRIEVTLNGEDKNNE